LEFFTSILPEAFSTAFTAPVEALSTTIFNLDFKFHLAKSFTHKFLFQIILFSSKIFLSISVTQLFAKSSKSLNVIILYSFLKIEFEKPLSLGILLNKGVCPHSNHAGTHHPVLAFCPLQPFKEKVHLEEPFHLQTLLLVFLAHTFALTLFNDNIVFIFNCIK
jgi:hypothetical protein